MSKTKTIDKMNKLRTHSTNARQNEDVLVCAPKHYKDLQDISDDYALAAKMLHKSSMNPALKKKVEQSINGEDIRLGPASNYKSKYDGYNHDN